MTTKEQINEITWGLEYADISPDEATHKIYDLHKEKMIDFEKWKLNNGYTPYRLSRHGYNSLQYLKESDKKEYLFNELFDLFEQENNK